MASTFDQFLKGDGCPLCAPRPDSSEHWDLVAKLGVSSLYLSASQTYRGQCQLIFDARHASRPDQLSFGEWAAFCADLYKAQDAVMRTVQPDHVNLESLGNVVPHLHWHIVPRYRSDPRWGAPIWLTSLADMVEVRLQPAERSALVELIRGAF
jgi:diadenosine tetraphosphate (Ap4A) HIT family hydrolase